MHTSQFAAQTATRSISWGDRLTWIVLALLLLATAIGVFMGAAITMYGALIVVVAVVAGWRYL
jgi:hypothetical protein